MEEDDEFPLPDYSDSDDNDTSFPEDSNVDYESDARGGNIPSGDFLHFDAFLVGSTVFALINAPGAFEIGISHCHVTLQLAPPVSTKSLSHSINFSCFHHLLDENIH